VTVLLRERGKYNLQKKILLVPDPVGVARSINRVQKSQTWLIKVLAILLPLQYVCIAAK